MVNHCEQINVIQWDLITWNIYNAAILIHICDFPSWHVLVFAIVWSFIFGNNRNLVSFLEQALDII